MDPLLSAFGVPVTITRPAPDNTPVTSTGIWLQPLIEDRPVGTDFQRREPRRVMGIPRSAVATMPRLTSIVAPERSGEATKTWKVDGLELVDADHWRVILTL